MRTVQLGTTDLSVSNLCLGTMQFGWTASKEDSFAVLDAFFAAGGSFLDTADIYSNWVPGHPGGEAEQIIGEWLRNRGNRDSIVIATKARGRMWQGPDGEGLGRAHLTRAIDDSLRRLGVESIDLYQCHWPDDDTPIDETLRAFDDLRAAGKLRYIGASNYTVLQMREAAQAAAEGNVPGFVSLQPHYNLVHRREFEGDLADLCVSSQIGVIPYSPLAAGFLTGKYRKGAPTPRSQRAPRLKGYMNERGYGVVETLVQLGSQREVSPGAVALAWLLAQPAITAPIIGANSVAQLDDLLPAAGLELSAAELAQLDAASR